MKSHWTSYFVTGSVAIIVSWALTITLSGCRLGNNAIYPAPADPISGYYASQAQSVVYSATLSGQTVTTTGAVSQLDPLVSNTFTNPMAIELSAPGSLTGDLISGLNTQNALPLTLAADQMTLPPFTGAISDAVPAWLTDSSCTVQTFITYSGMLDPLGSTPSTGSIGDTPVTLIGRLSLSVTISIVIQGSTCSTALQNISACYLNQADCAGQQSSDFSFFDPWIAAQTFTGAGIANLTPNTTGASLSYQIQYQ
jgi:hypothetical protein